jgi:copper chaperone NosL
VTDSLSLSFLDFLILGGIIKMTLVLSSKGDNAMAKETLTVIDNRTGKSYEIPIRLSKRERVLIFVAALLIIPAIFLPVWTITLVAPQYPKGIRMSIYANKLTEYNPETGMTNNTPRMINGLNHYIGMHEIKPDEFKEFRWLPFAIIAFSILALLSAIVGKWHFATAGWILFIVFGVFMIGDFFRWLYEYGHNLSPQAAIKIDPYMPPVIGWKQLANFKVISLPGSGAILMGFAAILGPIILWLESKRKRLS